MSEISMYEIQKKKMDGLCDEHDLIYRFMKDQYPITFTVRPAQGLYNQMSMLENEEEVGYRSPEASMTWIFEDGVLTTKVEGGTFTISKTLRGKIESVLVKMISYWQQFFFRDVMEKGSLRHGMTPVIDEEDAEEAEDEAEPIEDDEFQDQGEENQENIKETLCEEVSDEDIATATRIVRMENKAGVSLLQRRMNVGYKKANTLLSILEGNGVIGPWVSGKPREVLPYDLPEEEEQEKE